MKKFVKEFKEFAMKGNMVDMAIGVIIGGAFSTLVAAFMANIVNPLIGLIPGVDSLDDALKIVIKDAVVVDGVEQKPEVAVKFGAFIAAIITFIILALVVFIIVKAINKGRKKAEEKKKAEEEAAAAAAAAAAAEEPAPEPEPTKEEILLAEIRDLLKNK